jgi:putative glutamine amidotransferase
MARRNKGKGERKPRSKKAVKRPTVLVLEALSGSSRAVARAGGGTITNRPNGTAFKLIDEGKWDALLLTGGSDISPMRYGAKKVSKHVYGVDEIRDYVEIEALKEARRRNAPVLGICRGAQMLNVEAGGTLRQHVGFHHSGVDHFVYTKKDSVLANEAGQQFYVISLHHQSVGKVAPNFRIVAEARDGMPEAIEGEDGRCLGVQFHPEMAAHKDYAKAIFRWLVVEAAKRADVPVPEPEPVTAMPRLARVRDYNLQDDGWWDYDPTEALPWDDRRLAPPKQLPVKTGKNRTAGTRTLPAANPVTYSWYCNCHGMLFDSREDRDDHEMLFGPGRRM